MRQQSDRKCVAENKTEVPLDQWLEKTEVKKVLLTTVKKYVVSGTFVASY